MKLSHPSARVAALCGALALATLSTACAPLLLGGAAVGGALMVTDRRTSGAQVEDQAIEIKAINAVRDAIGSHGHVNITSYNRRVLITGEVPTEAEKSAVEQAVARIENVREGGVVNELAVQANSSLGSRSNDVLIDGKVKATLVDAKDILANAFKVVTERGTVHLMGIVTEREAERAVELARSISGVQKVVRAFDIITEDELARRLPKKPATE